MDEFDANSSSDASSTAPAGGENFSSPQQPHIEPANKSRQDNEEQETPARKPGFFGRLFGAKSKTGEPNKNLKEAAGGKLPAREEFGKQESGPEKFTNWEPLDVSSGVYRGKDLRVNTEVFKRHVRDDLKDILPKFSKRNALAEELSAKRANKLTKSEVREAIDKMHRERKISSITARKLRTRLGARKTSFF